MRIRMLVFTAALSAAISTPLLAGESAALISEGESQLRQGKIDDAIETLQQAVAMDPKSSLAYTRLGGAQTLKQDYGAAVESFKQAIMLDGKNANAFVGMAVAYLHTSRYELARAALGEAKRLDASKQEEVDKLIGWIDERAVRASH